MTEISQDIPGDRPKKVARHSNDATHGLSSSEIFEKIEIHDIVNDQIDEENSIEKFSARLDTNEDVVSFINRVYSGVLDGRFTRADLTKIDPLCEAALEAYEAKTGRPVSWKEVNLPSVQIDASEKHLSTTFQGTSENDVPEGQTKPLQAPEFYLERASKDEKAPEFIRRVYGAWLNGDFTRADLRRLDEKCANALRDFESKQGKKVPLDELNLPTVKERNTRLLKEGLSNVDPRERRRLQQVQAQRDLQGKRKSKRNSIEPAP